MQQICLANRGFRDRPELIGKTVKGVSFLSENRYKDNNPYLIITFTDDTYIYLCAKYNDDNDIELTDDFATPLKVYASPPIDVYGDEIKYYPYIEEEIRLGLIEPDREMEKKRYEEQKKAYEEREYQRYLELKAKFEK